MLTFSAVGKLYILFILSSLTCVCKVSMCEKCVKTWNGFHTSTTFLVGQVTSFEVLPLLHDYSIITTDLKYLYAFQRL